MQLENETPVHAASANAAENTATDSQAASSASADEQAASSASADEQAASNPTADEQAASSASPDEQAASNASADEQAASNASADEQAASSASADEQAASSASADEQAVSSASASNNAASSASAEDIPPADSAPPELPPESAQDAAASFSPEELLPFEPETPSAEGEDARLKAVIEAIIYVTDEPLSLDQISAALELPRDRAARLLEQLAAEYEQPDRGLSIREVAGGYKLSTKAEHHDAVRRFVKNLKPPLKLSLPALETMAVIAYKQPITAPEIMEIRGVQGAGVLKTLLDRKLIATAGRKNVVGKPILYKTTREFLVQFGLKDLSELPTLKEFQEIGRLDTETPTPAREETLSASAASAQSSDESANPAPPNEPPDSAPPREEPPPSETPVEDPSGDASVEDPPAYPPVEEDAQPDQPSPRQVEKVQAE